MSKKKKSFDQIKKKSKLKKKSKENESKKNLIRFEVGDMIYHVKDWNADARNEIFRTLRKKYSKEKAIEIEKKIFELVKLYLAEKYFLKEPVEKGQISIYLESLKSDDIFFNWIWNLHTIPYYQSLGDTFGFRWEFNNRQENVGPEFTNELIYEFISLGGINDISILNWSASDDTILYMATFKVLIEEFDTIEDFGQKLRLAYLEVLPRLEKENRGIGETTKRSLNTQKNIEWNQLHYDTTEKGAGSAMRSGCIGIFFPGHYDRENLIALAIECSRITHNSAIAILGSVVSALFTAYAIEKVPIAFWPHKLRKLLESKIIDEYMEKSRPNEYQSYLIDKVVFVEQWKNYIDFRFSGITPKLDLKMMKNPVSRFKYLSENYSKRKCDFPGACGDDATIMAYDALLESGGTLEKLLIYSILHPGDSDTVGSIAFSWFGAFYYNRKNYNLVNDKINDLEFFDEIYQLNSKSFEKLYKVYYYDLYLHFAHQILYEVSELEE